MKSAAIYLHNSVFQNWNCMRYGDFDTIQETKITINGLKHYTEIYRVLEKNYQMLFAGQIIIVWHVTRLNCLKYL